MNYSGFERENWPPRNGVNHRENVEKIQDGRTINKHMTQIQEIMNSMKTNQYFSTLFDYL